jgi:hypothetical protein
MHADQGLARTHLGACDTRGTVSTCPGLRLPNARRCGCSACLPHCICNLVCRNQPPVKTDGSRHNFSWRATRKDTQPCIWLGHPTSHWEVTGQTTCTLGSLCWVIVFYVPCALQRDAQTGMNPLVVAGARCLASMTAWLAFLPLRWAYAYIVLVITMARWIYRVAAGVVGRWMPAKGAPAAWMPHVERLRRPPAGQQRSRRLRQGNPPRCRRRLELHCETYNAGRGWCRAPRACAASCRRHAACVNTCRGRRPHRGQLAGLGRALLPPAGHGQLPGARVRPAAGPHDWLERGRAGVGAGCLPGAWLPAAALLVAAVPSAQPGAAGHSAASADSQRLPSTAAHAPGPQVDPRRSIQQAHELCIEHGVASRPLGLAGGP